jgi:exodeoxyribonuclease VII large subunit
VFQRYVGRRLQRIDDQEHRLRERMRGIAHTADRTRRSLEVRLKYYDPRPRFARDRRRLELAGSSISQAIRLNLARRSNTAQELATKLAQLSPLRILERGYAIVTQASGEIVKDSREASAGSDIHIRLGHGELDATVNEKPR